MPARFLCSVDLEAMPESVGLASMLLAQAYALYFGAYEGLTPTLAIRDQVRGPIWQALLPRQLSMKFEVVRRVASCKLTHLFATMGQH